MRITSAPEMGSAPVSSAVVGVPPTIWALGCFEEVLKAEPHHGEALVKRGLALEALQRPEEALACYNQAIAANADLTIAFLQKGGLLNRLERYEEALQCYELALHAQEKAHAVLFVGVA